MAMAKSLGAESGTVHKTRLTLSGDIVISATGAWAGHVAEMAHGQRACKPHSRRHGCLRPASRQPRHQPLMRPQTMATFSCPSAAWLSLAPHHLKSKMLDYIPVLDDQVKEMFKRPSNLSPPSEHTHMRGAYMSARPLIGSCNRRSQSLTHL